MGSEMVRTVVVGASSGLGRCIGVGLAQRGAKVALMARRKQRLEDAAADAGPGTLAIACDVTDAASCRSAIDEAAAGLGGIDALVYAPGIGPLSRLVDMDADTWARTFATNVTGAALVTAAAIPHLTESAGVAVYLSSVSASLTPPWPGLGAYAVSKAALDKLVEAWRAEHPDLGFTRLIVGDCAGGEGDAMTEFPNTWDPALAAEVAPEWVSRGLLSGTLMNVEQLVNAVEAIVRTDSSVSMSSVTVAPRPAGRGATTIEEAAAASRSSAAQASATAATGAAIAAAGADGEAAAMASSAAAQASGSAAAEAMASAGADGEAVR